MEQNNKRIVLNTGVMYVRLIITTIIGLLSSRYVLLALGVSDYGLYAVVGGLISMLNIISTAMHTTTRRYINVEMGKVEGDLNRIFNISRLLHVGFAIFIFLLAETVGLFYIYNFMNIDSAKFDDAIYVFQFSTTAAAISIINVPYQALVTAYEKFVQIAVIDILGALIKFGFILTLILYEGNVLRYYAIGMSILTVITLAFYNIACYKQWYDVVKYKFYKDIQKYKEILFFNNYVAMGAASFICRTQGSTLLVNYFFGTIVNAAFAVGYAVENYCMMFVNNVGSAAAPQMTQNYADDRNRSIFLMESLQRISILLMLIIAVPLSMEMEFILKLWLKEVPEGAAIVCHLTLISALARLFSDGTSGFIQASGRIKWFQIVGSILEFIPIPVAYVLFVLDFPAYSIIIVYIISCLFSKMVSLYLMKRLLSFNIWDYIRNVYPRPFVLVILFVIIVLLYREMHIVTPFYHYGGIIAGVLLTMILVFFIGLNPQERRIISRKIRRK